MNKKSFDEIDLFIFDMDGLLFDTETIYMEYGREILENMDYNISDELLERTIGLTNEETKKIYLTEYGKNFPYDEISLKIYNYIIERGSKGEIPLMKGAQELLKYLFKKGKKIVLGTSSDSLMANTLLESKGIKKYFSHIVTSNDVERGKPDPEVFLRGAGKLNINPSKTIVFEDSINGIKAAYVAGMLPIMIPNKINSTEEIDDILYEKFDDLFEALEYLKK